MSHDLQQLASSHPGVAVACSGKSGGGPDVWRHVLATLDEILGLHGRAAGFSRETPLLGAIPELDSMAVTALLTSLEDRFGFVVDDDEIDGAIFATAGALADFVADKLAG